MNMIAKKIEAARCAIPGGGEVGMAEGVAGAGSAAGASFCGASLLGGAAEGAEAPPLKTKTCTLSYCKIFLNGTVRHKFSPFKCMFEHVRIMIVQFFLSFFTTTPV